MIVQTKAMIVQTKQKSGKMMLQTIDVAKCTKKKVEYIRKRKVIENDKSYRKCTFLTHLNKTDLKSYTKLTFFESKQP